MELSKHRNEGADINCPDGPDKPIIGKSSSNVGLGKTNLINEVTQMPDFEESQFIETKDIDAEYDKLHAAFKIAVRALHEIESWPHGIERHDTAEEAAHGMNARATKALTELA